MVDKILGTDAQRVVTKKFSNNPDAVVSGFNSSTVSKNPSAVDVLQAEIDRLKEQLINLPDSNDRFDQIRVLQDTRRVRKKYVAPATDIQNDMQAGIKAQIEILEDRLEQIKYDNDNSFGQKVIKDIEDANVEYLDDQNKKIVEEEKKPYLDIINEFGSKEALDYFNSTFKQDKVAGVSVNNSYYLDSVTQYSTNEQLTAQTMVSETINLNGMSVRYLPRHSDYVDEVWNEEPESHYHKGFMVDMMLLSAGGFEGEGHTMTQYGLEFKEEVELAVSIDKFTALDSEYRATLVDSELLKFGRVEPLEGDLIIIPFGRSANNPNNYTPKVFQIDYVTTYTDGVFFQLGELYQHRIKASLYELSAEDINFSPVITRTNIITNVVETLSDSDTGYIYDATQQILDSDIADSDGDIYDKYADNHPIEERAQAKTVLNSTGRNIGNASVIIDDYTSDAFGLSKNVISDLDDI